MDEYAQEQRGDADDVLLEHLKKYGHFSGYMENGDQWELTLYHEGDEANGRELIEIKGVKLWHKIRPAADLPPLPIIPSIPLDDE
jgi:hypothetical protein